MTDIYLHIVARMADYIDTYLNPCSIAVEEQLVLGIPAAKVPGAFNWVVGGASRRVEVDVHLLLRSVRSVLLDLNHRDDADVSHRRVGHVQR